jgi:hypothetical protein
MNRSLSVSLGLSAALLLGLGFAAAQQPSGEPAPPDMLLAASAQGAGAEPPMNMPLGERIEVLGLEGLHGGKVVTGAPFSATATSETVQILQDGNRISRKTQTLLFRDSQGRFRKEATIQGFGPLASGQPRTFIILRDPVAGTAFALEPERKIARQLPNSLGRIADGVRSKLKEKMKDRIAAAEAGVQTEDLGKQTISGVIAQGTRHTRTIPAGQIGNDKPINIVSETWFSTDLQMVIMSKRSDPRFGETTYTVSNIQRKEPDASLFSVPSDYTVKQGRLGRDLGGFGERHHMGRVPPPPPAPQPPPAN